MAVVTIFILLGITGAEALVRIVMVREQVDEVNAYVSEDKLFVCVARARLRWEGGLASWLWQFARGLIHPFGAAISDLTVDRGILVVRIHERKISKNYLEGQTFSSLALRGSELVVRDDSQQGVVLTEFSPGESISGWSADSLMPQRYGVFEREFSLDGYSARVRIENEDLNEGEPIHKSRTRIGVSVNGGEWQLVTEVSDRWSTDVGFGRTSSSVGRFPS